MINLLPEQNKHTIAHRYHVEVVRMWCMQLAAVFAVGIVCLLPSVVALQRGEIEREQRIAATTQEIARLEKNTTAVATIQRVNDRLRRVGNANPATPGVYERVVDIVQRERDGISVSSFTVDMRDSGIAVQIGGMAASRATLLGFVNSLEASKLFSSVSSPLSNLVKEHDLQFTVTLDGK